MKNSRFRALHGLTLIVAAILALGLLASPPATAGLINSSVEYFPLGNADMDPPTDHPTIKIDDVIDGTFDSADNPGPTEVAWGTVDIDLREANAQYPHIQEWWVWKTITNASDRPWFDLHVDLLVGDDNHQSEQDDGISFGEFLPDGAPAPRVDPDWSPAFADWTGSVETRPFDSLWLKGQPPVLPGESIHIVFALSGTNIVPQFSLAQHATVPEPGSIMLALLGAAGMVCLIRRRRQR